MTNKLTRQQIIGKMKEILESATVPLLKGVAKKLAFLNDDTSIFPLELVMGRLGKMVSSVEYERFNARIESIIKYS